MNEPVKSLSDAELAEIAAREQAASAEPWSSKASDDFMANAFTDIPRLLATIAELKAILADCTQDSLAYLAGVQEGRRQAEGLPQNHYRYDWFCETCGRETFHDCKDSGHERDSSQDYRKCLVCGAERWGWQASFK